MLVATFRGFHRVPVNQDLKRTNGKRCLYRERKLANSSKFREDTPESSEKAAIYSDHVCIFRSDDPFAEIAVDAWPAE